MFPSKAFLGLPSTLLLLAFSVPSSHCRAGITVKLEAAFSAPPLLVELLETAVVEKPSTFPILLDFLQTTSIYDTTSDRDLYQRFLTFLREDALLGNSTALSSWKLALAAHETAPRIEAQYQFWNDNVRAIEKIFPPGAEGRAPGVLIFKPHGENCWDPECKWPDLMPQGHLKSHMAPQPFDKLVGSPMRSEAWVIYVDPSNKISMANFFGWHQAHRDVSFRLRYRPPQASIDGIATTAPMTISGYGVELALKRTDYVVIDDRDASSPGDGKTEKVLQGLDADKDARDVKPLSSSELLNLGLSAADFVMSSVNRIDALLNLTQDLPKHAASLSLHNASESFTREHVGNREIFLLPGQNMLWINGVQISPRDVNIFALLEHLRTERNLVSGLLQLGFSPAESIALLSHEVISHSRTTSDVQRYDFRDASEGTRVIMWLNDIEKDKKYTEWPSEISALLQRTYPGQLPTVRRDVHNVVFPVDLTSGKDVVFVIDTMRSLVKRMLPIRFGLVPTASHNAAVEQAKMVYYLQDGYGLAAVMDYLEASLAQDSLLVPCASAYNAVIEKRPLRKGRTSKSLADIVADEETGAQITAVKSYLRRLSMDGPDPPFLANGAPIAMDENWMQALGQRVSTDLRLVQQQVYEQTLSAEDWLPKVFMNQASAVRNPLIVPEDEKSIHIIDLSLILVENGHEFAGLKPVNTGHASSQSLFVFLDVNTESGCGLLIGAADFAAAHEDTFLVLNHYSDSRTPQWLHNAMTCLEARRPDYTVAFKERLRAALDKPLVGHGRKKSAAFSPIGNAIGLSPGEQGILINGRLIGPIPSTTVFTGEDFETLANYERSKRIQPVLHALEAMGLTKVVRSAIDLAKLSSVISLSSVSSVPDGIFDNTPNARFILYEKWAAQHTCFTLGTASESALIDVVVSLDPVSEVAQHWTPVIKSLSEMAGVRTRIFLNPAEMLQELPVKRFYRQVQLSALEFDAEGQVEQPRAVFEGIPEDTLLTLALDTPPSWLVAPKESVNDLDNIRLSALRGEDGIDATYELEHILIEGHSRDPSSGAPPRGVQLLLSTNKEADFAGTIIMANLGYFQFKANPGVYQLSLQSGPSRDIFTIDSAGTRGYVPQANDETTQILLTSFRGATIFPRLSRRPGRELDDVLEMPDLSFLTVPSVLSKTTRDAIHRGGQLADRLMSKVGMVDFSSARALKGAVEYGRRMASRLRLTAQIALAQSKVKSSPKHADINIFSVASGHLYERMLNIMMVSVMKHTEHTVKFWFIEQFLSPSFKEFLPTLAAEYGFAFEMVTYKWPHWLRAQKEKQRVIWGYKILFLDVLFPLDLDKVIFVDADQIVRTDMYTLVQHDLQGAPYGFTPMCDSRTEMEGFRFWKQGYWKTFLRGLPYHISALYVVDLKLFRAMAAGDRLRQQYHTLSADPNSLSNLDQDLPNHMQMQIPIHSLPQEWLWCETWCSDESLQVAKTIDLCNNPQTKEPKLDRARRQIPEWTVYDDEILAVAKKKKDAEGNDAGVRVGQAHDEHGRNKDEL